MPQAKGEAGVPAEASQVEDGAMAALISEYCREAGVRSLKKQLEKIYRKVALKLVRQGVTGPQVRLEGGWGNTGHMPHGGAQAGPSGRHGATGALEGGVG